MNSNCIVCRPVQSYSDPQLAVVVDEVLGKFLDPATLTPTAKVVIKPNLLTNKSPEKAVTTHPLVIQEIVNWLTARNVTDITIAESGGGEYTQSRLKNLYSSCGMDKITDVKLNFDTSFVTVPNQYPYFEKNYNFLTPIASADIVINIAKLKTHVMATVTAGTKNMFGAVPGLQKPELHFKYPNSSDFCGMLVTIAKNVAPQVTIIDAIDCMEGDGPSGGTPRHFGYIFAGENHCALDHFVTTAMCIDPATVEMLSQASKMGFYDMNDMEVIGDTPVASPPFKIPSSTMSTLFMPNLPMWLQKILVGGLTRFFKVVPKITTIKCIGCGKCAEICPAQTISVIDKKAKIDTSKCISCFCCHEMCPVKAIKMNRKTR